MSTTPITVQLVTAPGCSKCEQVKQTIRDTLGRFGEVHRIEVEEVDLIEQPELATEHEIWATPAVIIDGELAFVGRVNERELQAKLTAAAERRP